MSEESGVSRAELIQDNIQKVQGGQEHITFGGLLAVAHHDDIQSIETEAVEWAVDDVGEFIYAIHKCKVVDSQGRPFTGWGDASAANVSRGIKPHLFRMSETRAKARALRDALNIKQVAKEELLEGEPAQPSSKGSRKPQERSWQGKEGKDTQDEKKVSEEVQRARDEGWNLSAPRPPEGDGKPATKSQRLKLADRIGKAEREVDAFEEFMGKPMDELDSNECDYWVAFLEVRI